jgi:hypothetical protein
MNPTDVDINQLAPYLEKGGFAVICLLLIWNLIQDKRVMSEEQKRLTSVIESNSKVQENMNLLLTLINTNLQGLNTTIAVHNQKIENFEKIVYSHVK